MKKNPGQWLNQAIVVLSCEKLEDFKENREYTEYREPDFDNQVTGIATVDKKGLGNLKLLETMR